MRDFIANLTKLRGRLWFGALLSLICLILALRDIDFGRVWVALSRANYLFVALAMLTIVLTLLAKTLRWHFLFYPRQDQVRYGKLFASFVIGHMVNVFAPARLGEVARVYLIGESEGISKASALTTVVVEKLIDMIMLLFWLVVLLPIVYLPAWLPKPGTVFIAAIGLMLVIILVLAYRGERLLMLFGRFLEILPELARERIVRQMRLALEGLEALRHWWPSLQIWVWSLFIWCLSASTNYIVFAALGLRLPLSAAFFLLIALQVGVAVPSSPGKVGIFHYLCILALSVFAVDKNVALSYGVILYFVVFLPPSLLGAFLLWQEHLSLSRLKQETSGSVSVKRGS